MTTPLDPSKFNPHDPGYTRDPYAWYAMFREQAPVSFVPLYRSNWVFRYDDVRRVLDDTELFLKRKPDAVPEDPQSGFDVMDSMPPGVFSLDPPRHTQVRTIVDPLFAAAITSAAATAEATARAQLKRAKSSRRIELVQQFAVPVPTSVLMSVLGILPAETATVAGWVSAILAGNDPTNPMSVRMSAATCAMALNAYFQAFSRCPAHANSGGLVQSMMTKGTAQGLLPEEVQSTAVNFVVAGYLSTVFLIATGTLNLVRNPAQLELLRKEPARMTNAIEEMLRFDAPAQLVDRYVAGDVELGGVQLKRGDRVTGVLGSANRDASRFKDPDAFDITRDTSGHVGFGEGIHTCIGASLVRAGAPAAFRLLIEELPTIALDGAPQWQTDPYLRSVANLPLVIG